MKFQLIILSFLLYSSLTFAQFDIEQKAVKGKVVNHQNAPLSKVNIKDERGFKITETDNNGAFYFPLSIPLKGNKPSITFEKKGFQIVKWKYEYLDFKEIILYPNDYKTISEEQVILTEPAPPIDIKSTNPIIKNDGSAKKTSETKQTSSTKIETIAHNINKEAQKLKNERLNLDEIKRLKEYITILENQLILNNIPLKNTNQEHGISSSIEIQKKIETLKTEIALKEKELISSELKRKYLTILIVLIILVIIPSTLAVIFFINNRKTKKLNLLLEDQVQEIQQANEEIATQRDNISDQNSKLEEAFLNIRSSIFYAKRIQDSVLLKPEDIGKHFKDTFILYQPKDIVSGDFYWFSSVDNILILAAIDCTGHGVPGAFMTMLCNSFLNEIVNKNKILKPELILEELHLLVKQNLHQEEAESAQDGMDISLVAIDSQKRKLLFSGAHSPFWYIQNNEIQQIRGTRCGIGGEYSDTKFEVSEIDIQDISSFYLFSDGFQDQFSDKGKKFMKKNFRELLLSISNKPLNTQKDILEQEFKKWKGSENQTDDILVIGVNI